MDVYIGNEFMDVECMVTLKRELMNGDIGDEFMNVECMVTLKRVLMDGDEVLHHRSDERKSRQEFFSSIDYIIVFYSTNYRDKKRSNLRHFFKRPSNKDLCWRSIACPSLGGQQFGHLSLKGQQFGQQLAQPFFWKSTGGAAFF